MSTNIKGWVIDWFLANTEATKDNLDTKANYFQKEWLDSFAFISFVSAIEEQFKVSFSNEEFQDRSFSTIDGIVTIIGRKLDGK